MRAKEITLLAMLTAVLFAQETALSAIPNVQLSVMLIMVYAATLGIRNTTMILTAHVLLDNLLWGSFSPTVMIPMWIGWVAVMLIGKLLRKARLAIIVLGSVIGSIAYCLSFAIANSLVLNIDMGIYLAADLPFAIVMCCSSVVTVMFCYRPAEQMIAYFITKMGLRDKNPSNRFATESNTDPTNNQ